MSLPRPSKKESKKIERWLNNTSFGPMSWGAKNKNSDNTLHRTPPGSDAKRNVQYVPEPVEVDVNSIVVPEGHREIDKGAIDGLADSIQAIGLQHPITVRRGANGEWVLIAGRHRLEAYRRLGFPRIPARIMEERWARLWSISENLHRVDQTRLDRADAIVNYAKNADCWRVGQAPNLEASSPMIEETAGLQGHFKWTAGKCGRRGSMLIFARMQKSLCV